MGGLRGRPARPAPAAGFGEGRSPGRRSPVTKPSLEREGPASYLKLGLTSRERSRGRSEQEDVLTERFDSGAFHARLATAPEGAALAASAGTDPSEDALALALASLEDDKAEDVLPIDLRGKSPITDHMIVASGRSARQVTSIAEKLVERFKTRFGRSPRMEGKEAGDWVLVDCGDVIVHVFRPEVRAFYQIEKMWLEPEELRARAAGSA